MTSQAIALTHAYRTSGLPMTTSRTRYKTFTVRTDKKHVTHTKRNGEKVRYYEYGDAALFTRTLPIAEAERLAQHIARAGYSATVYPHSDEPTAFVHATTAVYDQCTWNVWNRDREIFERHEVERDEQLWQQINEYVAARY